MTPEQLATLQVDVLNYLDITWQDTGLKTKILGITTRGMAYLDNIAGATLDYTVEGNARALLFDYIRYVRSGALDDFQTNYIAELLSIQITSEVSAYVDSLSGI